MLNAHQARASIDWERVKKKAAEIVDELAFATPELKDLTFMPGGPMKPHNVLPIGFGFCRRCRPKKQTRQPKSPAALAKSYLVRRRRLPASSDPSQQTSYAAEMLRGLFKALDRVADILDECLKAGKLQAHPLQTTGTEGKLARHVPPIGAPFFGTMGAPLSQPVFSNLTSSCGNSGIGLMENAGAITAPLSQTTFGSLAGPVIINPVVTSVENAGALIPPVSRNVFVTPGMPLANAGKTVKPCAKSTSPVSWLLDKPC